MGQNYSKMQYSTTIATVSIFGAKTKIALTGVRSRVRESLPHTFTSVPFVKTDPFLVKSAFQQFIK